MNDKHECPITGCSVETTKSYCEAHRERVPRYLRRKARKARTTGRHMQVAGQIADYLEALAMAVKQ